MSTQTAYDISRGNDLAIDVGPITGINPSTRVVGDYAGTPIDGWIALAADDDNALGAAKQFAAIGGPYFVPFFDATEVEDALDDAETALGAPLVPGHVLYCVLSGPNDFRLAIPLIYRAARVI